MVKRSDLLAQVEAEAGVPYAQTRLAKRAPASRKRLALLMGLAALAFVLEASLKRAPLWVVPALAAGAVAWGVHQGRLGAVIAAGLLALLAALIPPALLALQPLAPADVVTAVVAIVLGAAALPDVVLLMRDAELQHAYGLWARRD